MRGSTRLLVEHPAPHPSVLDAPAALPRTLLRRVPPQPTKSYYGEPTRVYYGTYEGLLGSLLGTNREPATEY